MEDPTPAAPGHSPSETCVQCQGLLAESARFCAACGTPRRPAACPACGEPRAALDARYCAKCGSELGEAPAPASPVWRGVAGAAPKNPPPSPSARRHPPARRVPSSSGAGDRADAPPEGRAVAAFILSLVGIVFGGLILGPLAAVLGLGANSRYRKLGLPPSGLATAAVAIGSLSAVLWLFVVGAVAVPAFVKYRHLADERRKAPPEPAADRNVPPPAPRFALPAEAPGTPSPQAPKASPDSFDARPAAPEKKALESALPPPPRDVMRKVALELKASCWQESPLLNIRGELETTLKAVPVELTERGVSDAVIAVEYREKKGRLYKNQFDQEMGYGTDISFRLTVRVGGHPTPVLDLRVDTQPAQYLGTVKSVDEASLDLFTKNDAYAGLEALLGGALGQKSVRPKLVEALLSEDASAPALAILRWWGGGPEDDDEKAAFSLAAGKAQELTRLGEAGILAATKYADLRIERGRPYEIPASLISALGEMKDSRSTAVLLQLLDYFTSFLANEDAAEMNCSDAVSVLEALGKGADQTVLEQVDGLTDAKNPKLAAAAKKAAKMIRARGRRD